ncbi:MAG: 1,2-phenylacetyl-CoA epoxidase subunit PaaC [Ginsengibacter sp.]
MNTQTIDHTANHLVDYTLHLADNSLIMGHRLSEWTGHGPSLEQDIAITNIALDLIGQARNFYQYAATLSENKGGLPVTEDTLAYLRDGHEFKNLLITELPNGHWGKSILKIYFFSTWQYFVYQKLIYSSDKQLAAIAEKSLKEVTYHVRWSSEWVMRLGDGTKESHEKIQEALDDLWPYTGEMFEAVEWEKSSNVGMDVQILKEDWVKKVSGIIEKATLRLPDGNAWMQTGGKKGIHTEHLGYILTELQFLQRAYPGCEW